MLHQKAGGIKQDLSLENIIIISTSFLSVIAFSLFLEGHLKKIMMCIVAFLYSMLFFYFVRTTNSLSFAHLANNWNYVLELTGFILVAKIIYSTFFASDIFWSLFFSVLIFCTYTLSTANSPQNKFKPILHLIAPAVFCTLLMFPVSYEPVSCFLRSTYTHFFPTKNTLGAVAQNLEILPSLISKTNFKFSKRPNIFLVLIESFNSRFVNKRDENGLEFLPFFNQLTKNHLYFQNYYSNSIQTAKGHFSALCGQVPQLRGIEFKKPECFAKKCLASVLSEHDYSTYFFQAETASG